MISRSLVAFPAAILAATAVACGQAATSPSASQAPPVDACLVNTWVSQDVSGSITSGAATYTLKGGAGLVLTVKSDGTYTMDGSSVRDIVIAAPDGSVAGKIATTGTESGTLKTANGKVTVSRTQGDVTTQTLDQNGAPQGTPDPGTANQTHGYTCTPNQSLVETQESSAASPGSASGSLTVTYVPQGAASSGSAEPSGSAAAGGETSPSSSDMASPSPT